ncbi:hypothetical protein [Streptomyces hypolithicus]
MPGTTRGALLALPAAIRTGCGLPETGEERARYRLAFERTQDTMLNRGASKGGLKSLQDPPG